MSHYAMALVIAGSFEASLVIEREGSIVIGE